MYPATCFNDKSLFSGGRAYKGIHCIGTPVSHYSVKIYKIYKSAYRYNYVGPVAQTV